jgi:hypothetical protein
MKNTSVVFIYTHIRYRESNTLIVKILLCY